MSRAEAARFKAAGFKAALIANDNHPIPDWLDETLAEVGIDYVYRDCFNREDLEACARDADVLWLMSSRKGLVVEEHMDIFEKAGAAIKVGSGTDNIDNDACTKRGIVVTHTPDIPTEATSDHIIALLMSAVRQTARQDYLIRSGVWDVQAALPKGKMTGADLGLIGFGRIGRAVVRKLAGFEMKVRVCDPAVDAATVEAAGCKKVELDELLMESQYVLLAVPLTNETRALLGVKELQSMRRDAILVNGARGGIVDERAVVKALHEGWISAAAFDVWVNPVTDSNHELRQLDNLVMTPHMGGYSHAYPEDLWRAVVDVIIDLSKKRMPASIVNKGVTPRWKLS